MIRPWKVVLGVVLGVSAMPGSAMAQNTPPSVSISTPEQGAIYTQGDVITASYSCNDDVAVTECTGSVPNGAAISTATVGNFEFKVVAKDGADATTEVTRNYSVKAVDGDVGGETPATLNLTLGAAGSFSPFLPGVARDYTTSMSATLLSTADSAALSVADASSTATGHLVNGAYVLATALQANATSANPFANNPPLPLANVGGSSAPTTLLTYSGPVTNDVATLNFKQSITGTEALRTGGYSKTLTFTLSTTTP